MTIEYKDSKRIVTSESVYKVHTFLNSTDNFQITAGSGDVEYLVIAGGGGGGNGGGGAGGYLTGTSTLSTSTGSSGTHTVTIGTGGAPSNNGVNSVFNSITSTGGGAGNGGNGGSGGGGQSSNSAGSGTVGQGYAGGNGSGSASDYGGGGGGAGVVGTTGSSGGQGGNGLSSDINGTATFRAGGGGGGSSGADSAGGTGGGGIGKNYNGTSGTTNTGSGGGGNYSGGSQGSGGSGIVIVKYNSNDITATGGTITTESVVQTKPTDVQDNSILIEKDTAKRYWFESESETSSQTSTNSNRSIKGTSRQRMAQQFNTGHALVGENPKSATWYLYKQGSPTGNVTAHIRTSAGVEREQSTTLVDSSSLGLVGGGGVAYTFTFTGNTTLATGDMITAEFTGGSNNNEVLLLTDNTSAVTNSVMRQYTPTTWSDIAGEALKFIVNYTTATWTQMPPILGLGMFMGGNINPPVSANIDYITIATTGNSTTFGQLITARYSADSVNSETRAIIGSGSSGSGNVIGFEYITTASPSNATVFGDDIISRNYSGGVSNGTRGCWGGGYENDNTNGVTISYVTIATTGDATDFGDLSDARRYISSVHSDTRVSGVVELPYIRLKPYNIVQSQLQGNATSAGNFLTKNTSSGCGFENDTRGVFAGGDSYPNGHNQSMDYLTMASLAEATDFGDLSSTTNYPSACSSDTRGVIGGGIEGSTLVNKIQYVTIGTPSNSTDFGDSHQLDIVYVELKVLDQYRIIQQSNQLGYFR